MLEHESFYIAREFIDDGEGETWRSFLKYRLNTFWFMNETCFSRMRERRVFFTYFDMVFMIIITFLSFLVRNFCLARPQSPINSEEFEISFFLNFSNNTNVNGEEKSVSRVIKYFYIYFAQIDINQNFTSTSNLNQYRTYRYLSLRQYSTYFSMLCPCLLYIYLILSRTNPYLAKCLTLLLIFNQNLTAEARSFSSIGFYQLSFLLSLISITKLSSYDTSSLFFFISLFFTSFFIFLSFNLHTKKSFRLLSFYFLILYTKNNEITKLRHKNNNYFIQIVFILFFLFIGDQSAKKCEKLLKSNEINQLNEVMLEKELIYQAIDFPSFIVIPLGVIIGLYSVFLHKSHIFNEIFPFLFLLITFFEFKYFKKWFPVMQEFSIMYISALVIISITLTREKIPETKTFTCLITLSVMINIAAFIANAPCVYQYPTD